MITAIHCIIYRIYRIYYRMLSISKLFANVKISGRLTTQLNQIQGVSVPSIRSLSISNQLERRARFEKQFMHEQGFATPRKNKWRYGKGGSKNYWRSPEGKGNTAPKRMRTKYLAKHPSQTARVEDLPMFWMLEPMTEEKKNEMKKNDSIKEWQDNMVERGYEPFTRCKTLGEIHYKL